MNYPQANKQPYGTRFIRTRCSAHLVIQSEVIHMNTLVSEIDFVFYVSYAEYTRNRKLSS